MDKERYINAINHIKKYASNEIKYIIECEMEHLNQAWADAKVETFQTLQGRAKALSELLLMFIPTKKDSE